MRKSLAALLTLVAAPAFASDVPATNCEIFVDKIQVTSGSHGLTTVHFFLKIAHGRLDAPVRSVGVVHARQENRSDRLAGGHGFRFDQIPSFLGSHDYFEFTSVTGHDWMSARTEAAFVVETERGTRYWLNQGNRIGENFVIDGNMVRSLYAEPSGRYRLDGVRDAFHWQVDHVPQTADYPSDLAARFNPRRCR